MSLCEKHNKIYGKEGNCTFPPNECEKCIENAFNPKMCKICREKEGCHLADGLVICNECEELYFRDDYTDVIKYKQKVKELFEAIHNFSDETQQTKKFVGNTKVGLFQYELKRFLEKKEKEFFGN